MNVFGFIVGAFSRQSGGAAIEAARKAGEEDGRAAANAYADGLLTEAQSVLESRLAAFRQPSVTKLAATPSPAKLPTGKKAIVATTAGRSKR